MPCREAGSDSVEPNCERSPIMVWLDRNFGPGAARPPLVRARRPRSFGKVSRRAGRAKPCGELTAGGGRPRKGACHGHSVFRKCTDRRAHV